MTPSTRHGFRVGLKEKFIRSLAHVPIIQQRNISIASLLCNPSRAPRKDFCIEFYGYHYKGSINNLTDWCVYFADKFINAEMALVQQVGSLIKRQGQSFVCYDIGAGLGHMTLGMASCADKVIAVEPFPQALSQLNGKMKENDIKHVKSFPVGLGERRETTKFDVVSVINLIVKRSQFSDRLAPLGTFEAPIVRGDAFIEQNRLELPNFIRINAGDDPLSVIEGLSETIRKASPTIFIEMPLNPSSGYIDETALRAALYDDAGLFTFRRANDDTLFSFDSFQGEARRIVCIPPESMRIAE